MAPGPFHEVTNESYTYSSLAFWWYFLAGCLAIGIDIENMSFSVSLSCSGLWETKRVGMLSTQPQRSFRRGCTVSRFRAKIALGHFLTLPLMRRNLTIFCSPFFCFPCNIDGSASVPCRINDKRCPTNPFPLDYFSPKLQKDRLLQPQRLIFNLTHVHSIACTPRSKSTSLVQWQHPT